MVFCSHCFTRLACLLSTIALTALPALRSAGAEPIHDGVESGTAVAEPRLILVSWDGAGDEIVDRLLAQGRLPHLAALAARGARAEHVVGTWPTKTAPSHATLYTGCGPAVHGVTGNLRSRVDEPSRHTILDTERGFSSRVAAAEPLFVTTALEGLGTVVLGAAQYHPHEPIAERLESRKGAASRYRSFSGFEEQILPSGSLTAADLGPLSADWDGIPGLAESTARELELVVGDDTVYGLAYDDPENPVKGLDTVVLRLGSRSAGAPEAVLEPLPAADKPRGWSPPFEVRNAAYRGNLYFRLFHLAPDGSEMILFRRQVSHLFAHGPEDSPGGSPFGEQQVGATYDNTVSSYERGRLGRPVMLGGSGEAEARLVEAIAFDIDRLVAGSRFAWQTWRPRALFHYAPYLDQMGHALMAVIDPAGELYDPEAGPVIEKAYGDVAGHLDRFLGALVELGGDDTVVALVSDHGMTASSRHVAVNRILEDADLLARGEDGRIDLVRTRILAADSSYFLRVNDRRWREGTVAEKNRDGVVEEAAAALLAARDPENGRAVIPRVWKPGDLPHLGLGELGGDLYLDTAPGYFPVPYFPEQPVARSPRPWGGGTHGNWRHRRDMHAIFFVAGPGVAEDVTTPPVDQIDVAPTLARLLGIRPPADACGRIVHEALAGPRR